eukprot:TRINITY_DN11704_c0_g2_i1.p1 TRINITY_DN11704_c0_g2~~TRINITY_DN11704_c0_g2_i1.p1  ORF type:complete len:643 (+),score=129.40 TRINITY_DN11704_c0_g2_i1:123-1931(+)
MADEELAKDDDWYCQSCTEKQPSSSATTSKITKPSPASKKKLPKRKTATPKRPRKAAASISPAQTSSKSGKEKSQSAMTAVKAEAKAEAQAEGIVVVDGTCTFCNQHGNVITCYTCSKAYHLLCAQVELDELAKMAAWHCAKCVSKMPKPEKDKEEDTAALQALLRKVDVARVASGRSLSNSIRRKVGEQRKAGKVAGPTSALSSFLREKGIKAPPRGARWERSRRSEGAPADDDDDDAAVPDRALATSQEPELEVMPELTQAATQQRAKRARRATAVAEATRRVESALEGQRAGNESDDLSPSNKGKKGGQPAAKKSKSKKQQAKQASKGKKRQLKRVESSDDDFEDADNNGGDSLPENVGLCGSCGCRLPHGQMICLACRDRQLKGTIAGINRKRGKNKPKAGSLMHQLLGGDVLSLQELCVKLVCKCWRSRSRSHWSADVPQSPAQQTDPSAAVAPNATRTEAVRLRRAGRRSLPRCLHEVRQLAAARSACMRAIDQRRVGQVRRFHAKLDFALHQWRFQGHGRLHCVSGVSPATADRVYLSPHGHFRRKAAASLGQLQRHAKARIVARADAWRRTTSAPAWNAQAGTAQARLLRATDR